jgi:hypothetical protein
MEIEQEKADLAATNSALQTTAAQLEMLDRHRALIVLSPIPNIEAERSRRTFIENCEMKQEQFENHRHELLQQRIIPGTNLIHLIRSRDSYRRKIVELRRRIARAQAGPLPHVP